MSNDGLSPFHEQRRYRRGRLETAVAVTCRGQFLVQNCVNVSEGGLLLRVFSRYLVGDIIEVGMFVPGGQFVKAVGEVAYVMETSPGEYYAGVRFIEIASTNQIAIRDYVEQAPPVA